MIAAARMNVVQDDETEERDESEGLSDEELDFCKKVESYLCHSYCWHILGVRLQRRGFAEDLAHWIGNNFYVGVHPLEWMCHTDFQKMQGHQATDYPLYIRVMAVRRLIKKEREDDRDAAALQAEIKAIVAARAEEHADQVTDPAYLDPDDGMDPRNWRYHYD